MNYLDIVLGAMLVIAFFRGIWRGFVLEVTSLLAISFGLYGAIHFSFYVSDYLLNNVDWDKQTIQITAFVLTLFAIMIVIGIFGKILTRILEISALGFVNRLAGGIFGVLKWSVISGTSLLFFSKVQVALLPNEIKQQSVLYEPICQVGKLIYSFFAQA